MIDVAPTGLDVIGCKCFLGYCISPPPHTRTQFLFPKNPFLVGENLFLILFHARLVSENLVKFSLIRFDRVLIGFDLFLVPLDLFLIGYYLIVV
ncbi:MAG: hypothetical protein QOJ02_3383 [Acidobacteriota bacterium]|nr:hypothetical protein [Acidobacteriota bacterium]